MGHADEMDQGSGDFLLCKHGGHPSRFSGMFDVS